jgi:hypothetical protein
MVDFAKLKRNRSSIEQLTKALETTQTNVEAGSKDDTRFWQPTADKSGNGMATIRFLPAPAVDGDDALPWVRVFKHGFQGPGGWLIDECLTTINEKCPVCEHNSTLWNSGIEANKEIVRKQKRKLTYIANIIVVTDPSNPDNEGQVKLYKFGKKIFDKITEAMNPEFADETPMNPFDLWEGANFKLKIRQVEGYRNYDKSEFSNPSPLSDNDEELEKIWKSEYSLKEFTEKSNFKSYDELKKRLDKALGFDGAVNLRTKAEDVEVDSFKDVDLVKLDNKISEVDVDEELDYFNSLAKS